MKKLFFIQFFIYSCLSIPVLTAQQVVAGRITDASDGQPLAGAHIFIANTNIGTASNASGDYKLTVSGSGSIEISVSYIGYESFFYKIDTPKPFHTLDVALKIYELPEIVVKANKTYSQSDVNLFWEALLGVRPARRGLEVLNPGKVYFYKNESKVLKAYCNEPVEVVNHEMGYHIRYMLASFSHDYKTGESLLFGMPFFEELAPSNDSQKRQWEKKRQEVYSVSLTRFIRALYHQNLHDEGFMLSILGELRDSVTISEIRGSSVLEKVTVTTEPAYLSVSLSDILQQGDQEQFHVTIDSLANLFCFSKPVPDMTTFKYSAGLLYEGREFPVVMLPPQQFTIYSDGTYSGVMRVEQFRGRIWGLSATTPLEYGLIKRD